MIECMKINDKIFRAYDVRGIIDYDLNPRIVESIGKAFGTYLFREGIKDVLVGRDSRETSEEYERVLIKGLISTGCNVYKIGLALSSIIAFSRHYYDIDGAVMITASHNPSNYNGFKFYHGINSIAEDEIQRLKEILLSQDFESGNGKVENRSPAQPYFDAIKDKVNFKKYLRVVVDSGNATPGIFIPDFINKLGHEAIPLYCDLDPTFPNHHPDPVPLDNYKGLINKVIDDKADLGVMFDSDGDRIGFVDEKGNIWQGDIILTLLIREIIPKNPARKVIIELKNSEMVFEETQKLGGVPIFWKTGHSLINHKVYDENAILSGEMSCHYWIVDNWYCFDDAIYAMTRILQIISNSDKNLSELVNELPRYETTPEYRIPCPEEKKNYLIGELVEYFKNKCDKIIDIEGIRGYMKDGWFLIRASNTEPMISIRFEAKTKDGLEKIKKIVEDKIFEYPFINPDWAKKS